MSPELAIKYNLWQVGSVIVSFMVYQKSKVGISLIYMQHRHMECVKLHIFHDLVLDQNVNDNSYSTPFRHEDLDVDHKILILVIGLYHNTFSHICVQHQNYPEHDIICLSIFFTGYFSVFSLINDSMFMMLFTDVWNYLSRLTSLFCVKECIRIYESNIFDPSSWTFGINWYIYRLTMALIPLTNYLSFPGALIPQSIITE